MCIPFTFPGDKEVLLRFVVQGDKLLWTLYLCKGNVCIPFTVPGYKEFDFVSYFHGTSDFGRHICTEETCVFSSNTEKIRESSTISETHLFIIALPFYHP